MKIGKMIILIDPEAFFEIREELEAKYQVFIKYEEVRI